MAKGDFRRAFTMHLRNFDLRVTELRRMYALLSQGGAEASASVDGEAE